MVHSGVPSRVWTRGISEVGSRGGACQEDIFYHYKIALHKAYAEDTIGYENEERIKKGLPIYTAAEYTERLQYYMSRIPYKLVKCRYHSFQRYFHWLKQLGWVELTGREERSTVQENMPDYPQAPPRRYYRLTKRGIEVPDHEWSNPQLTLYPERPLEYFREKRKQRKYFSKAATKRH